MAVVESEDLGTLTLIIWDMAFVPTRVFSTGFTLSPQCSGNLRPLFLPLTEKATVGG